MVVLSKGLDGQSLRVPSGNHSCLAFFSSTLWKNVQYGMWRESIFPNSSSSDLTPFQMKGYVYNNMFCFLVCLQCRDASP